MSNLSKLLTVLFGALALTACTNTEDPSFVGETNMPEELLDVTYEGKTYLSVPTQYDDNGDFIFLDEELAAIYQSELSHIINLAIELTSDHSITLYKSLEDGLRDNGLEIIDNEAETISRSLGYDNLAILDLYDDKKFKDTHKDYYLTQSVIEVDVPNLKKQKFNDKCSSLILTNNLSNNYDDEIVLGGYTYHCDEVAAVFVGYDDTNYSDRQIFVVANPQEIFAFYANSSKHLKL